MMYCDNCKADFSDGMTYCKWCGQVLREKRMVTTQLQKCPSCSTPVQGEWTFCNVCGANILEAAQEPFSPICARCGAVVPFGVPNCLRCGERVVALPTSQTPSPSKTPTKDTPAKPAPPKCAVCGESVDKDAAYCKVCGAPIYSSSGTHPSQFATQVHMPSPEAKQEAKEPLKPSDEVSSATLEISSLPTVQADTETVVLSSATPSPPPPKPPTTDAREGETLAIHSLTDTVIEDDQRTAAVKDDTTTKPVSSVTAPTDYVFGIDDEISFTIEPDKTEKVESEGTQKFSSTSQAADESWQMIVSEPTKTYASFTESSPPTEQPTGGAKSESSDAETRTKVISSFPSEQSKEPTFTKPRTDEFATPPSVNEAPPPPLQGGTIPFQGPAKETLGETISNVPPKQAPPVEPLAPPLAQAHAYPTPPVHPVPHPVQAPPFPSKKKKGAFPVVPLILILVILAGAAAAIWWFALRKPDVPAANVNASPTANTNTGSTANTNTAPAPTVPEGMVLVAAGSYTIGRDDGDDIEKPIHKVNLIAFFIDKTEVTNAEYKKFIDATGHRTPPHWKNGLYESGKDNFPVVQVSWQDATEYARWAGKRLPTEVEWEAAARGPEGRKYPWGNEPKAGTGNIGQGEGGSLTAVGQFPDGKSVAGALDMVGNAWEWTADNVALYPGNTGPTPPEAKGKFRIIRGGAFDSDTTIDASYRGYVEEYRKDLNKTGFRCVKDAN
jgi:gamma-glutamyl hercynylcysteine S-oxide synthase